jgi:hypothetical protein
MRHANISTTMTFYADVKDAAKAAIRGKHAPNEVLNTAPSDSPPI